MGFVAKQLGYIFLLIFIVSCENNESEIERVTAKPNDPIEEIAGLKTIYSDSGHVKVLLEAAVMKKKLLPKPITELSKGMKISFYDANMQVVSHMSSNYAIHYEQEHRWEAKNNVEVVNLKGEKLNTEKLIWDERNNKLLSDNFVKITTPKEIIMGNGFEADQDFNHYKIFNVTGHITLNQ
ncbi:MAG: LPS export ABC transporter periplasmic protein LptC [Bacteroidota bacterium]